MAGPTGELTSSENSLNQHVKLKHPELWDQYKRHERAFGEVYLDKSKDGAASDKNEHIEII